MRGAWPASKPLPKRTEAKIDLSNLKVIGAKPYIEARGKVEILLKSQARDASRLKVMFFLEFKLTPRKYGFCTKSLGYIALYIMTILTLPQACLGPHLPLNLHALNGKLCKCMALGLIKPQNVMTPMAMQMTFTM